MMGINHPRFCVLATALVGFLCLYASAASAQCTKDTDCKGARICTNGTCLYPPDVAQAAAGTNPSLSHGIPLSCVCQPVGTQAATPAGYPAPVPNPAAPTGLAATDTHAGPSVRLSAGLGYWHTGFSHPQPSTIPAADASGFTAIAMTLSLAMGGVVWRNLTVFGEVLGTRASEPRVKDSQDVTTTWPGTYGLVSIGPGVSYYFDRLDAYASGTLTITRLFGKEIDANLGRGANLGIGKDWQTTTGSRVGVLAAFQYARADDEYRGTTVSLVSSLRFSVAWQ